jgi:effector-binding domain-containing protein
MEDQFEINQKPAQPTLSIRFRSRVEDLPRKLGETYGSIVQYLGELDTVPSGPPFAAYYNMDMQDLDIEAGFPVSGAYPAKGEIRANEIPAGNYGSCLYVGPYADCGPAYERLTEFVKGKGYEPSGAAYEYYLNDPMEVPHEEPQTLIVFPLQILEESK